MRRGIKKVISLVLAGVMVFSMAAPASVRADSDIYETGVEAE